VSGTVPARCRSTRDQGNQGRSAGFFLFCPVSFDRAQKLGKKEKREKKELLAKTRRCIPPGLFFFQKIVYNG